MSRALVRTYQRVKVHACKSSLVLNLARFCSILSTMARRLLLLFVKSEIYLILLFLSGLLFGDAGRFSEMSFPPLVDRTSLTPILIDILSITVGVSQFTSKPSDLFPSVSLYIMLQYHLPR